MPRKKNPCSYEITCMDSSITPVRNVAGKKHFSHEAFPRNVAFSYMPPAYYAKGFRILEAYKRDFDFTEMRKLLFLEDPEKQKEWGVLRKRLPHPENRVVDLPGTRDLHYKNYFMRRLTPESAMSWRNSIVKPMFEGIKKQLILEIKERLNTWYLLLSEAFFAASGRNRISSPPQLSAEKSSGTITFKLFSHSKYGYCNDSERKDYLQ